MPIGVVPPIPTVELPVPLVDVRLFRLVVPLAVVMELVRAWVLLASAAALLLAWMLLARAWEWLALD